MVAAFIGLAILGVMTYLFVAEAHGLPGGFRAESHIR